MHWKLKVTGYGKIEAAEIETAPLTLFVGDNNSGKIPVMYRKLCNFLLQSD